MSDAPSSSDAAAAPVVEAKKPNTAKPEADKTKKPTNTNNSKRGRNAAKGLIEIEPVTGTRDFYPEEMRLRNWLFDNFKAVAKSFCFQVRKL